MIARGLIVIIVSTISFLPQPLMERYGMFALAGAAILALALVRQQRRDLPILSGGDAAVLLFALSLGPGSFFALNSRAAIPAYAAMSAVILVGYISGKVAARSRRDFGFLCAFIVSCILLVGAIALVELAAGASALYERFVPNVYYTRYIKICHRPIGPLFNPVILGSYFVGCLPFCFFFIGRKGMAEKIFGIAALAVGATMIILTASRGVFLGLSAAVLFYAAARKNKRLFLGILCFIALTIAIGTLANGTNLRQFGFKKFFVGSQDSMASKYRTDRVLMAARVFREHPAAGLGWNNFRWRFYEYARMPAGEIAAYEQMITDNMYLGILAESGLIGVGGFTAFLIYIITAAARKYKMGWSADASMRLIPFAGFVGLLVHMASYDLFYWYNPFLLLCFLAGLAAADAAWSR
ncbi:MAG TPA: O-antigen ligase family protein [Candidatus Omnitrophota bacterium]|nr:O-antigen ligase family protein [Candidatus Omnitrophota bacterium]HQQ06330.1 O-antigen ligase family protein [Candidatus Omnitrophota bacterium]